MTIFSWKFGLTFHPVPQGAGVGTLNTGQPRYNWSQMWVARNYSLIIGDPHFILFSGGTLGNNKVSGQLENFFRWNPSGTFRNIPWHHWNNPKKVPGAPSQGFLKFLVFVKNSTKLKNWLSRPHFWADFQVSYHFGKLLTVRLQGHPASKNLSLHQWDMSISNFQNWNL